MNARVFVSVLVQVAASIVSAAPSQAAEGLRLEVSPATSLIDAPLDVEVSHVLPGTYVTIVTTAQLFGNTFESRVAYRVNFDGRAKVDAAHLLGSLHHEGAWYHAHTDPLAPLQISFNATNGDTSTSRTVTRVVAAADVVRSDIHTPAVYGTSFFHRDGRRRAAIIVLGGSEGGVPETRAALLASHGFNTLALAYFGVGDLPRALADVPIERVRDAVGWLQQRKDVDPSRIGILGASKGAELALVAAAHFRALRFVVALKPSSVVFEGLFYEATGGETRSSWSFHGQPLPYANGAIPAAVSARIEADRQAKRPISYSPMYLAELRNATNPRASTIQVERIRGPILLVSGDDDGLWPSSYMAKQIMRRLHEMHHPYADRWLHYAGAGHGIGEAYAAYDGSVFAGPLNLGGTPAGNTRASADSWPRVITFLKAQAPDR